MRFVIDDFVTALEDGVVNGGRELAGPTSDRATVRLAVEEDWSSEVPCCRRTGTEGLIDREHLAGKNGHAIERIGHHVDVDDSCFAAFVIGGESRYEFDRWSGWDWLQRPIEPPRQEHDHLSSGDPISRTEQSRLAAGGDSGLGDPIDVGCMRRKIVIAFSVRDIESVGRGTHVRYVVESAKTHERLAAKRALQHPGARDLVGALRAMHSVHPNNDFL